MKLITNKLFGEKLKYFRLAKNFKQVELTAQMHLYGSTMSSYTYSKIELGNRNINLDDFIILKLILEFEYQDFFDDFESEYKNIHKMI